MSVPPEALAAEARLLAALNSGWPSQALKIAHEINRDYPQLPMGTVHMAQALMDLGRGGEAHDALIEAEPRFRYPPAYRTLIHHTLAEMCLRLKRPKAEVNAWLGKVIDSWDAEKTAGLN